MSKYSLIITGISRERAKELAEDFGGGSMMWNKEGKSSFAYPSDDSSIEIKEHKERPQYGR